MSSKQERQSEFLEHLQENGTSVRIFLTNGFQMYGTVIGHDQYCVYLDSDGKKKWYTNMLFLQLNVDETPGNHPSNFLRGGLL